MRCNVKDTKKISESVIRRLPRYRRYIGQLREQGIAKISSCELSEIMGSTAPQIRQDLNQFGGFGQQGYGYNVEILYDEINNLLQLKKTHNVAIVGIGNIGQALVNHLKLNRDVFTVVSLFDNNPEKIGKIIEGVEIKACEEIIPNIQESEIEIAVLCVPAKAAQRVAERLDKAGVKSILNFSPTDISVSSDITVENVRINDSLYYLLYYMGEGK